MTPQN